MFMEVHFWIINSYKYIKWEWLTIRLISEKRSRGSSELKIERESVSSFAYNAKIKCYAKLQRKWNNIMLLSGDQWINEKIEI